MEFGAGLKPDEPIMPDMVELGRLSEEAGFDYIGIFDDLLLVDHMTCLIAVFTWARSETKARNT